MKALVIDDDSSIVRSLQRLYSQNQNVVVAQCRSVEQALRAVETHRPGIIFLDHSLTPNGDEGLEVARKLKADRNPATIYSITGGTRCLDEYAKLGIEIIPKSDIQSIVPVIET